MTKMLSAVVVLWAPPCVQCDATAAPAAELWTTGLPVECGPWSSDEPCSYCWWCRRVSECHSCWSEWQSYNSNWESDSHNRLFVFGGYRLPIVCWNLRQARSLSRAASGASSASPHAPPATFSANIVIGLREERPSWKWTINASDPRGLCIWDVQLWSLMRE